MKLSETINEYEQIKQSHIVKLHKLTEILDSVPTGCNIDLQNGLVIKIHTQRITIVTIGEFIETLKKVTEL